MNRFDEYRKIAMPRKEDRESFDEASRQLLESTQHERTRDAAANVEVLKNPRRRIFMLGSAALTGIAAFELNYIATFGQDWLLGDFSGSSDKPFNEPTSAFIDSLDRYRADGGRTALHTATESEAWLKLAVENSVRRDPHRDDIFQNLNLIIANSRSDKVRSYAGGLAATSLTRVGDTIHASELLIASTNVGALDPRGAFNFRVELCMEQFVGLQHWQWNKPHGWSLQETLGEIQSAHPEAFDFDVMDTSSPHYDMQLLSRLALYGVPFLHAHFFGMQAATAAMVDPEQRRSYWKRQIEFYRRVVAIQKNVGIEFRKTLWNHLVCLYIQAAEFNDSRSRRYFFDLLTGTGEATFVDGSIRNQLDGDINIGDHMYILFLIAVNTTTWNDKRRVLEGSLGDQLEIYVANIELIPNPTICAALDTFRKIMDWPVGVVGPTRRYAICTGGFDHYVIPFKL